MTPAHGIHDMPELDYHALRDTSLSASGAKLLVPPSTPAHYRWAMDHAQPTKKAFDLGTAAHALALGTGPELVEIPDEILAKNGAASTTDSKAFIAEARERGAIPLKADELAQIRAMADALRAHPIAGRLFTPGNGKPEQSLFWQDVNGVTRRARLDWLPSPTASGRLIIPDLKTTVCAEPGKWIRQSVDYGVHMQHANYVEGVKKLGLADDAALVFVVQEKTAPYLVSVIEIDTVGVSIGRDLMDMASRRFAHCHTTGTWPGYGDQVHPVSLPAYYVMQIEGELS